MIVVSVAVKSFVPLPDVSFNLIVGVAAAVVPSTPLCIPVKVVAVKPVYESFSLPIFTVPVAGKPAV